jgi:ATP synthase protein I
LEILPFGLSGLGTMDRWGPASRLMGVGFYIAFCLIGGAVGGLWLDRKLGTQPVFVLVGLISGLILASWGVYRMLLPMLNNNKKERR